MSWRAGKRLWTWLCKLYDNASSVKSPQCFCFLCSSVIAFSPSNSSFGKGFCCSVAFRQCASMPGADLARCCCQGCQHMVMSTRNPSTASGLGRALQKSRDLSAELQPLCNSYKSGSGKCQCLLDHALNIIEQMFRELFIHAALSNEWAIMLPFYIFKSSVKICLKRRNSVKCTLLPFTFRLGSGGFFPPVSKIITLGVSI